MRRSNTLRAQSSLNWQIKIGTVDPQEETWRPVQLLGYQGTSYFQQLRQPLQRFNQSHHRKTVYGVTGNEPRCLHLAATDTSGINIGIALTPRSQHCTRQNVTGSLSGTYAQTQRLVGHYRTIPRCDCCKESISI